VEGLHARAVDKGRPPKSQPPRLEDVKPETSAAVIQSAHDPGEDQPKALGWSEPLLSAHGNLDFNAKKHHDQKQEDQMVRHLLPPG